MKIKKFKTALKSLKITLIAIIGLGLLSQNIHAAARTWVGAGGGTGGTGTVFNTAANWTGFGALLAVDDLTMNISGTVTITLNASVTINSFTFNVTGGNTGTLDMVSSVLTMNGAFVCNAVDFISPPNYSYLRIYVGTAAAGLVFNNTATFHTTGAGITYIFGPTANPGFVKFYNNVTFGPRCRTAAGVEPDMYFDAVTAQTITVNIDPSTTYTMPEDVWYGFVNSPTVTFAGSNQPFFFGSYDGNVRIKNTTIVKANLCTLDGFSAVQDFYMDPGTKLEISNTNDFPQGGYNNYFLDVTSTVEYLGAATAQTVTGTSVALLAYGNLIIGGSGNKTPGSGTITKGNFTIRTGATFLSSTFTHENRGHFTNDGTFTAGTSIHTFTGTAAQNITSTTGTISTFNQLRINNSGTGVFLQLDANTNATATGVLDLLNGPFHLNSFRFTVQQTALAAVTRTNGYVVSETNVAANPSILQRNLGTITGAFIYPFGVAGTYIPFTFNKTTATAANVSVSTRATTTNLNTPWAGASNVAAVGNMYSSVIPGDGTISSCVDRWWDIQTSAAVTANLIFSYRGSENTTTSAPTGTFKAQHWNGLIWELPVGTGVGVTAGVGTVSVTGASTFSPWIISSLAVPLPIELLGFIVQLNGQQAELNWETASETNNDYFTVEKSKDGQNFEEVIRVQGAGTSNSRNEYFDIDPSPYAGVSYYRLKQTDFDGAFTYSNVVPINNTLTSGTPFSLYPNPVDAGNNIYMTLEEELQGKEILVVVRDISGRQLYSKIVVVSVGNEIIAIDKEGKFSKGTYLVTASSNEKLYSKKLIIK